MSPYPTPARHRPSAGAAGAVLLLSIWAASWSRALAFVTSASSRHRKTAHMLEHPPGVSPDAAALVPAPGHVRTAAASGMASRMTAGPTPCRQLHHRRPQLSALFVKSYPFKHKTRFAVQACATPWQLLFIPGLPDSSQKYARQNTHDSLPNKASDTKPMGPGLTPNPSVKNNRIHFVPIRANNGTFGSNFPARITSGEQPGRPGSRHELRIISYSSKGSEEGDRC
jgi:hypothetical protein